MLEDREMIGGRIPDSVSAAGKMEYHIGAFHRPIHSRPLFEVALPDLDAVDHLCEIISASLGEIISNDDVRARLYEPFGEKGADEPSTAGHDDSLIREFHW